MTRAASGLRLEDLTLEAIEEGRLSATDVRIGPDALRRQAAIAEADGNPQLGENLRRAAELTAFSDDEVLALYDALRPGRATQAELEQIVAQLSERGAPLCSALVAEALAAYSSRGLLGDR